MRKRFFRAAVSSRAASGVAELRKTFQLFVYGTLRSGERSHEVLKDAQLVGTGTIGGVLYDIDGEYPALVLYGHTRVRGEVWRCPNALLSQLDSFEGVAERLFRRIGVEVHMADGSLNGCWTYVAGPALSRKLVPAQRIDNWPVKRMQ